MDQRFSGRTVLVTGATGIGAATAERVAAEGGSVFVVSLDEEPIDSLRESSDRIDGMAADLTDESAAEAAFARCLDRFGQLDGVLAVAGGSGRRFGDGPVDQIPLSGWEATVAANMTPMFLTVREAVRNMSEGGSIVVTTSVLASHPQRMFVTHAYAAAKSSAIGFVRAVAARYASRGIRVNAVAPGLTATPMAQRAASDAETVAYAEQKQPLAGGLLPPESVAAAVTFLLSDDARHITGQILSVDGGATVTEA